MAEVASNNAVADYWNHPISQPYIPNRHSGVDFAYAGVVEPGGEVRVPFSGHVTATRHDETGGTVLVSIDGVPYTEAFAHLNQIYVRPGDAIQKFQTEIGTTGGGVGDLLLYDGFVHAAERQSDFGKWSTGKHLHFSIFKGNTEQEADRGWSDTSRQVNPTDIVNTLRQNKQYPPQFIGGIRGRRPPNEPIPGRDPGQIQDAQKPPRVCTPASNPLDVGGGINFALCELQNNIAESVQNMKDTFAHGMARSGVMAAGIIAMGFGLFFLTKAITE